MRSRDTRSFTVELKSKRRSTAAPPSSIWGHAATLFKEVPEPSTRTLFRNEASSPVPTSSVQVTPKADNQSRRILPDLRVAESAPLEEALPIRVTRSNRKKGRVKMSENIERQGELPIDTAPTEPDEIIGTVSTSVPEPVDQGPADADNEDALWEASAPDTEVTQDPQSFVGSTSIVVPPMASRRDRKWTRRVEDLPRGERWKRRLPGVCR
jgi:hypothetical protein